MSGRVFGPPLQAKDKAALRAAREFRGCELLRTLWASSGGETPVTNSEATAGGCRLEYLARPEGEVSEIKMNIHLSSP
jgi:hypothetical protein